MTTIAWDGKTLAADKQAVMGSMKMTVTKLFRARGYLVAAAGDFDRIVESVAWFAAGADPAKLPPYARDNEDYVSLLVIEKDGTILRYERGSLPYKIESPFIAVGTGREYAMAAMHLGCNAREAVGVAIALDCNSGMGIDTMEIEP